MSRWIKIIPAILMAIAITPVFPAFAQTNADCDFFGTHSISAKYCITMPPQGMWNGDLIIFAHGYVPVTAPVDIPWDQMTFSNGQGGFIYMPDIVNSLGYAFATTSYSENGLVVQQGIADILDLVQVFKVLGTPVHIYLLGASEGGLVTTLAIEKHPDEFTGGMALCGPIGNFNRQVNYWGDFRTVFDYFMDTPGSNILPGNAVSIPAVLMNKWDSNYVPLIGSTLIARPGNTQQLLAVTGAPVDPVNPNTIGETALGILWYNAFATRDAIKKLGGQPFDNRTRVYSGSANDTLLNLGVKRYKAKPAALAEIASSYETSGILQKPLVVMHTTGDPIVPYWHETDYTAKVGGNPLYLPITINRYGHCAFTLPELLGGFVNLVTKSTGITLQSPLLDETGAQVPVYEYPLPGSAGLVLPSSSTWTDNFDGPTLDSRWSWIREDPSHWSLTALPGFLRIITNQSSSTVNNILVQVAPLGDYEIQTRLLFTPTLDVQSAGLVIYQDDGNYLIMGRAFCDLVFLNCIGNGIYFEYIQGGNMIGANYAMTTTVQGEAYLKLVRHANVYTGYVSTDGSNWTLVGTHTVTILPTKIGLTATNPLAGVTEIPADFDYFTLIANTTYRLFLPLIIK
jgi:pimeloyl-ACP methyl ester carboxylesterase